MYSYLTDTNDVFRDINVAEIYNDNEQARTLLKRASGDFLGWEIGLPGSRYFLCRHSERAILLCRDSKRRDNGINVRRYHWLVNAKRPLNIEQASVK